MHKIKAFKLRGGKNLPQITTSEHTQILPVPSDMLLKFIRWTARDARIDIFTSALLDHIAPSNCKLVMDTQLVFFYTCYRIWRSTET
jgi:hypothetical protein